MSPAGGLHGWVMLNVGSPVRERVRRTKSGYIFGAETGFLIERDPDTVRAPDVAFVRLERVKHGLTERFFEGAPDLAAEVLSPTDSASEVHEKAEQWLRAGCSEVWLIDPRRKSASRCTPLLPDFLLPVDSLFDDPASSE